MIGKLERQYFKTTFVFFSYIRKIKIIINHSTNVSFRLVTILNIFKAFLEMLSVGIFYPFLELILNKDKLRNNNYINWLEEQEIISGIDDLVLFLGLFLIIFFMLSGFISIYAKYKSDSLVWQLNTNVIKLCFKKYINEPLEHFKNSNTNEITHNIVNEVHVFINGFMVNFIDLIPRIFILTFFVAYLGYLNPLLTLSILLIFVFIYTVIIGLLKNKIADMSDKRYYYQSQLQDYVNSSIKAIKDIRVNYYQYFFTEKVAEPAHKSSNLHKRVSIFSVIPKYFIESLVLIFLTLYVILFFEKDSLVNQIPFLSVLALSLFKIFPIIQGLYSNYTRINYTKHSLDVIYKNILRSLSIKNKVTPSYKSFESLQLDEITFSYNKKIVLNKISFKVNKGDFYLIYGESGSGKSTLLEVILGFFEPSSGKIILNGDIIKDQHKLLSQKIKVGYVSQDIIIFEGSLSENITMINSKIDDERFKQIISLCQLEDVVKSIGGTNGTISEGGKNLSAGQRQRIILARALFKNPELLILDEGTSALNEKLEMKILSALKSKSITVIMITHNESLRKLTKNIIELT